MHTLIYSGSMKDKAGYASPEYDTADHVQLKQWGSTGKGIAGKVCVCV